MTVLFNLNPAAFATPGAFISFLQQTPINTLVPDLTAFGGALILAGYPEGRELGRDAERILGGKISEVDERVIWGKLRRITEGISQEKWKGVRKRWEDIQQDVTRGPAEALERRALLFRSDPREAIRRFGEYPAKIVAHHPLVSIVRLNGETDRLRIMLIVRSGAEENQVGKLVHHEKRLEIQLKFPGGKDVNRALQEYLASIFDLGGPEDVQIISGREHSNRKSIFIRSLSLSDVLDRLNELGPKLVFPYEMGVLEKRLRELQEGFRKIEGQLREAEVVVGNIPEEEAEEFQPILKAMNSICEEIRKTISEVSSLWVQKEPFTSVRLQYANELLTKASTQKAHFEDLKTSLLKSHRVAHSEAKRFIELAIGSLGEAEGYLSGRRQEVDSAVELPQTEREECLGIIRTLEGKLLKAQTTLLEIQKKWMDGKADLNIDVLETLQKQAIDVLRITTEIDRETTAILQRLELFVVRELKPAADPLNLTENQREIYKSVIPLLEILAKYTQPDSQGLSPLRRKNAYISARLKKIQSLVFANFGEEYWPGSIPADHRHLSNLSEKIEKTIDKAQEKFAEAMREIQKEDPIEKKEALIGKVESAIYQGLNRAKMVLGVLPEEQEGIIPMPKIKKAERGLVQQWEEASIRLQQTVEKERVKPFHLSERLMTSLREFRETWMGEVRIKARSLEGYMETVIVNPKNPWKFYRLSKEEREEAEEERETLQDLREPEIENLYDKFRQAVDSIYNALDSFSEAFDELTTELAKPKEEQSEAKVKRLFFVSRNLKTKIGNEFGTAERALKGKTKIVEKDPGTKEVLIDPETGDPRMKEVTDPHNLTTLILEPQKAVPKPRRPRNDSLMVGKRKVIIENDIADIDGVKVTLPGQEKAQDQKIRYIIEKILHISKEEQEKSVELAFWMFKEEVRKRLEQGKPIRKLIRMDEGDGIAIVYDFRFGTAFYVPWKTGWLIEGARAMMPMFHGGGGARSTGFSMVGPMFKFRKDHKYNTITFDTPNHGFSFKDERFSNLDEFVGWAGAIIEYCRYLSGHRLPVIALGRSHGDNVLDEYATRNPGKLAGTIHVSGYDPAWTMRNLSYLNERIRIGDFEPSLTGLPMVMAHEGLGVKFNSDGTVDFYPQGENQWTFLNPKNDVERRQTPSIYLQGGKDADYSVGVPLFYKERKARAQRLGFEELTAVRGQHDLISLNTKSDDAEVAKMLHARMLRVYEFIYKFVEERIEGFDSLLRTS